jgi:tetratricopeptide (TPR) repeat protein
MSFLLISISTLSAQKTLERIANETGVEGETLYNEGKYTEAAQKFEEAVSTLLQAVEKDGIPLDKEKINQWWLYAFNGYYQSKDYENALKALDERLVLNPGSYELINYKSIILHKNLKRSLEAIEVLKEYNQQKRSFRVENKIADYYADLDDLQNALTWYEKAYELKKDSKVIKNIATLHVKLGNNAQAIKAYEDFIETKPGESVLIQTYKNLGTLHKELNQFDKSNAAYEKALNLKYDSALNLLLITSYYDMDQYDKALSKIDLMLKNQAGNVDAIYYRAIIKYNREDKIGAKADFQRLLGSKYDSLAKGYIESIESE